MKQNRIVRQLLLLSLLLSMGIAYTGCSFVEKTKNQALLKATSKEINKSLPMDVDVATVLETTEVLPDNVLKYVYKVKSVKSNIRNSGDLDKIKEGAIYMLKKNKAAEAFLKLNPTLVYEYRDVETNEVAGSFTITPEEYNAKGGTTIDIYAVLTEMSDKLRPQLPIEMDEGFFLIGIEILRPAIQVYTFQFKNVEKESADYDRNFTELRSLMLQDVKNNPTYFRQRENDVTFRYCYVDANNTEMGTFDIIPADYK